MIQKFGRPIKLIFFHYTFIDVPTSLDRGSDAISSTNGMLLGIGLGIVDFSELQLLSLNVSHLHRAHVANPACTQWKWPNKKRLIMVVKLV